MIGRDVKSVDDNVLLPSTTSIFDLKGYFQGRNKLGFACDYILEKSVTSDRDQS